MLTSPVGKPTTARRADGGVGMSRVPLVRGDVSNLSEVRFLTVAEVATAMRVSKMTVYRLVHAGELSAVRVGRSYRVPERAVQGYLRRAFNQAG